MIVTEEIKNELTELINCGDPVFESSAQFVLGCITEYQANRMKQEDVTKSINEVTAKIELIDLEYSRIIYKYTINNIIKKIKNNP